MRTLIDDANSLRGFAGKIALVIFLLALAIGFWYLRSVLMLIFFSAILAVALSGPVDHLKKRGWSHGLGVLVTLLIVVGVLVLMGLIILPSFINQIESLIQDLPDAVEDTQNEYNRLTENISFLPKIEGERIDDQQIMDALDTVVGSVGRNVLPFLSGIGGILGNLLIIVVLTIYLLSEPSIYVEGILTLAPRDYRPRAYEVLRELARAIRLSIASQVIAMFIVGFLAYIGLLIIGVENALALAVISGVLNFIPTFGALIALVIAIVFTVATNGDSLPWVILWYLALQQLESNLITPRIVRNTLSLPGAMIISTQIISGALFGFLGIMLAVPLVAVLMVLVRELYVYDVLNSRKANLVTVALEDGRETQMVSSSYYRPPELSPGETATLLASGTDPFEHVQQKQTIEILGPAPEQMARVTQSQQVVWVAILALVAAQALALIRGFIGDGRKS